MQSIINSNSILELSIWILLCMNNYNNYYLYVYVLLYMLSLLITSIFSYKFTYQKQLEYNNFADKRCICCIKNFGDVSSNLMFFIAGFYQIYILNTVLGILSIFVGIGSIYYHWTPNINTLYYDRLPMVICMAYEIHVTTQLHFGYLLLIGLYSLNYHSNTKDLILYVSYQFTVILLFSLVPSLGMIIPVLLYKFAKLCEDKDKEIFNYTNNFISGHTIKHILAGTALLLS